MKKFLKRIFAIFGSLPIILAASLLTHTLIKNDVFTLSLGLGIALIMGTTVTIALLFPNRFINHGAILLNILLNSGDHSSDSGQGNESILGCVFSLIFILSLMALFLAAFALQGVNAIITAGIAFIVFISPLFLKNK